MTKKRFTDIEHDYENAWIKCKDDGDFMIYPIYDDSGEELPSLGDLLNGLDGTVKDLSDDYERLLKENKELKRENREFKALLDEMSNCNNEIWLNDGRIYRLNKILKI